MTYYTLNNEIITRLQYSWKHHSSTVLQTTEQTDQPAAGLHCEHQRSATGSWSCQCCPVCQARFCTGPRRAWTEDRSAAIWEQTLAGRHSEDQSHAAQRDRSRESPVNTHTCTLSAITQLSTVMNSFTKIHNVTVSTKTRNPISTASHFKTGIMCRLPICAKFGIWQWANGQCLLDWYIVTHAGQKTAKIPQFQPNFHIYGGSCAHPLYWSGQTLVGNCRP